MSEGQESEEVQDWRESQGRGRGGGGEEDAGAGGKDRVLCLQSMFSWVFIFLPSSLLRPKHLSYVEVSLLVQFPSFLRLKEAFAECGKKW